MIDHLLRFESESAAQVALPAYRVPASELGPAVWRGDICIPSVTVTVGASRVPVAGWFILIALPEESVALRPVARLIIDRDTRRVIYIPPDASIRDLSTTHIEPLFAGSDYSHGVTQ